MNTKKNGKSLARLLMLVMTLVFALALTGCDNGFFGGGYATDPALNGSWKDWEFDSTLIFNNGNFESNVFGVPVQRGTFTTSNNDLVITLEYIHGILFEGDFGLGFRWYTVAEVAARAQAAGDAEFAMSIFLPWRYQYFISGNRLTLINHHGHMRTLYRN